MLRKLCIYWTDIVTMVCLPSCDYSLDPKTVEQIISVVSTSLNEQ